MEQLEASLENAEFQLTGLNNDKQAFANNDENECCVVAERAIAHYEQLITDVRAYVDNIIPNHVIPAIPIPAGGRRRKHRTKKHRK
jgi:hypothetical protein